MVTNLMDFSPGVASCRFGSTGHQRKCPVMDTLEDKHEDDVMVEEMFVE